MGSTDVAEFIHGRDAKLDPVRLGLKYHAMRGDCFSFFRATSALFHARLPKLGRLMDAPPAWSCGDLHLENFGTFRARNGLTYFDINDFDEALLAPCSFDVLRACASIAVAGKSMSVSKSREEALIRQFIGMYAKTLHQGEPGWIERDSVSGPIGRMVGALRGETRKKLLDKRTIASRKSRTLLADGKHALEAPESEKARVARLLEQWARKNASAEQLEDAYFDVVDVALRIAGLGSLGVERYVILIRGTGDIDDMRLLDLKRARPSATVEASKTKQPKWSCDAERVCTIQRRMQVKSPANLSFLVDRNRSYVLRELQPREDRLDLAQVAGAAQGLETAITGFAHLTAWAQLRSAGRHGSALADELVNFGARDRWPDRLMEAARNCADRSLEDWASFCRAYDKGAFTSGSSPPH